MKNESTDFSKGLTRRKFLKYSALFSAAAASLASWEAQQVLATNPDNKTDKIKTDESGRPNFIYIFVDDGGYADIEPFGSKINRTPNLNRMAAEGMKLTSHYSAPVCSPARAQLMTGSYAQRIGLSYGSYASVLRPGDRHGLNPQEETLAKILKKAGYATGCFGKWHLGDQPQFLPTNQGFDDFWGIPYSNNQWPLEPNWDYPRLPFMHNDKVVGEVATMQDQAQLCRLAVETAISFIKQNKHRPFFAYIPHVFTHTPCMARPEFMARAKDVTQAQVEELDWAVGQIFEVLRELNLDRKTVVFWVSDNGGEKGNNNDPLRGQKGSTWEGGTRVPAIAWWPAHIPAGSVSDEVTTTMDMLPTFASLAGTQPPNDRVIDGHDIRSILLCKSGAVSPYEAYFYYRDGELEAVRCGDWKLRKGELYNLAKDIGETTNLAQSNPDMVKKLQAYMTKAVAELGNRNNPGPGTRPVGKIENARTILPRPGLKGDIVNMPSAPWPAHPDAPKRPVPDDAYAPTGPEFRVGNSWMICPVCLYQGTSKDFKEAGPGVRAGFCCPVCTRLRPLPQFCNNAL